jgi:hypothetical protein
MVGAGEHVGDTRVWTGPIERRTIAQLAGDRRALFLFYLFDWSST